jgi:hypothetical protein
MTIAEFSVGNVGGGAAGDLQYPGLSQMIVEYAMPAQIFRQLYVHYPSMGRQSVTIPKESDPANTSAIVASRVGEGDELPLNILPVTSSTVSVYKVGEGYQVTREMILFQQVPIIQQRLKRLGITIGNTIDYDCAVLVEAAVSGLGATYTNAVSGKTKGSDNTIAAEAGTLGQYDIVDATVRMMNFNLFADTIVTSPVGAGQLRKLPQFSSQLNYGTPRYEHGELGEVEGLRVLVSRHVGAKADHTIVSPNVLAYVMTGTETTAPNPLGQYTPMGYYVEALPIQTMVHDNPRRDSYEVYAESMFAPVVVTPKCIQRLSVS